ncbi:MAG: N-6 DNA methylase, partial [Armatimonadetes bacterium]|nr:N-6 DNA methylase [Armatimonadota bacterium]NIO98898.1 N-6 DNA methylase [Armatimonadota bacterium]
MAVIPDLRTRFMAAPLQTYLREIKKTLQSGGATERSYYPALKRFLEDLVPGITATPETKRIECGVPDFRISRASSHGPLTVGYVEAKDLEKPLDKIEKDALRSSPSTVDGEQLKRYLRLDNLLFTNFLDFRWYVDGERRGVVSLAVVDSDGKLGIEQSDAMWLTDILAAFLNHKPQDVSTPKDLALRMAKLTHTIRDIVVTAFETDKASDMLRYLRGAFAKTLIPDLEKTEKTSEFADMFAQTLAYGLFAARCNHQGPGRFRRLGAAREIPKTNPFLRELFDTITGTRLDDEPFAGFVDDLAQLLADCDMAAILEHFGKRTRKEDPVVHFYETFLAAYDPKIREMRGVYYTPEPVVSYIVRSVDYLLKARFNCPAGLADTRTIEYERIEEDGKQQRRVKEKAPRVLLLDPACGTGTFLYAVVDHIRDEFKRRNDAGM